MTTREPQLSINKEVMIPGERNKRLLKYLEIGLIPALPFEATALDVRMQKFKKEQYDLGVKLGEAMSQSSETWHDNAPADAINMESVVLANQADKTNSTLTSSVPFDYPQPEDPEITLGSLIEISYDNDDREVVYLTGITRDIDIINSYTDSNFPDSFMAVTISSPLGQCLIGAHEGENHSYTTKRKKHSITILSVAHQSLNPKSI